MESYGKFYWKSMTGGPRTDTIVEETKQKSIDEVDAN